MSLEKKVKESHKEGLLNELVGYEKARKGLSLLDLFKSRGTTKQEFIEAYSYFDVYDDVTIGTDEERRDCWNYYNNLE